jgi:hypothetical protein
VVEWVPGAAAGLRVFVLFFSGQCRGASFPGASLAVAPGVLRSEVFAGAAGAQREIRGAEAGRAARLVSVIPLICR